MFCNFGCIGLEHFVVVVKSFPYNFIHFYAIINGIVFQFQFPAVSSNILYVDLYFHQLFCRFFRFSSVDDNIVSMHFISFCCLVSLARYSNIKLNRSSKSEYYCLVPSLRDKAFSH